MSAELTLCLCNYARPQQMHELIGMLRQQSCELNLVVWNNDPEREFKDDRADWVINSNRNVHTNHVVSLWQQSPTPYVGRMDDDLYPADTEVVADTLEVLKRLTDERRIVAAYGVRLFDGYAYPDCDHFGTPKGHGQLTEDNELVTQEPVDVPVDVVKGRYMILRQSLTHLLSSGIGHPHTDLYVSCTLAQRTRNLHVLAGCLYDRRSTDPEECGPRLINWPEDELGYCAQAGHHDERDRIVQMWLGSCRKG